MIKLGRIDIITEMSSLLSYVVLTREGHLNAVVPVMSHVGQRYNSRRVCDPSNPEINHGVFKKGDWSDLYRDA